MTDKNPKAGQKALTEVKFTIAYAKRQDLDAIIAHVRSVEKATQFDRIPIEESFTADGVESQWHYISHLRCAQPSRMINAFREGLSAASPGSSVRLRIPASENDAEMTVVVTSGKTTVVRDQ